MSKKPKVAGTAIAPAIMSDDTFRFLRIRKELDAESDRGAAMLSAAYVDSWLEKAIKSRLCDTKVKKDETLFDRLFKSGNAPIQSFSAKIDLAYSLKMIGLHSYTDLHIIRDIRNDFAHYLDFDKPLNGLAFTEQSIGARCNNLWFPKNYVQQGDATMDERTLAAQKLDQPRDQYLYAALAIADLIQVAISQTDDAAKLIEDTFNHYEVPRMLPDAMV